MSAIEQPTLHREEYAERICINWQRGVQSTVNTGKLLIRAKRDLKYGEFSKMVEADLPFSHRTTNMLMKIAEHPIIGDSQYFANLPPSWSVLYAITELPEEEVGALIAQGKITPETRLRDVKEIKRQIRTDGLYLYEKVACALKTLIAFRSKWPDTHALAEKVYESMTDGEHAIDLDDIPTVGPWIDDLYAAVKRYEQRREREYQGVVAPGLSR